VLTQTSAWSVNLQPLEEYRLSAYDLARALSRIFQVAMMIPVRRENAFHSAVNVRTTETAGMKGIFLSAA
jgi:hypothetical protein